MKRTLEIEKDRIVRGLTAPIFDALDSLPEIDLRFEVKGSRHPDLLAAFKYRLARRKLMLSILHDRGWSAERIFYYLPSLSEMQSDFSSSGMSVMDTEAAFQKREKNLDALAFNYYRLELMALLRHTFSGSPQDLLQAVADRRLL